MEMLNKVPQLYCLSFRLHTQLTLTKISFKNINENRNHNGYIMLMSW